MTSAANLNRLLSRLEHNLLSPESDLHLRSSQYERNRVGANIEHARAMLLSLEKGSATVKVQSQRQQTQADLQQKREILKRLNTRLRELNDAADSDDEESEGDDGDEDVLHEYAPARRDVEDGLETGEPQAPRIDDHQRQELRSRKPLQDGDDGGRATTTAREQLFQGRSDQQDPNLSRNETMMSHNRTQQEALTSGLLKLARDLKESSLGFQESLATDKDVVTRAEGGLDKSAQAMDAAQSKMSMLRRMSEGQGWWGRIKLYGFIFGLWLACFLLVFIGPKLRF